ncbi:MAG: DUF2845 domain-containing protein [Gammaproteobacteria bacterium]|nr:DUF2845 domain-containing protein [Gammaproteobacteria bacterium]MDH5213024.1 DUF2845 domain-containing protein [Gammaproteobacteria bacterium]
MNRVIRNNAGKHAVGTAMLCSLLLLSHPAEAFRCGSRIIRDGMHEGQVIALCGDPIAIRQLGLVLRSYSPRVYSLGGLSGTYYRHGYYNEVVATEFVYNFGPRKLIRILRFEGGYLVDIKTAGYGYLEKDDQ